MKAARFIRAFVLVAGLAPWAVPLCAQPGWQGSAAVGVEVRDKTGAVIVGATVALHRGSDLSGPGPDPLATDREGHASFAGLAEGEWVLQVTHPDYMAYRAYIETKTGKEPKSTFAAQVATNQSFSPMRVALYKSRGPAGTPLRPIPPATTTVAPPAPPAPPPPPTPTPATVAPIAPAPPATSAAPSTAPPPAPHATAPAPPAAPAAVTPAPAVAPAAPPATRPVATTPPPTANPTSTAPAAPPTPAPPATPTPAPAPANPVAAPAPAHSAPTPTPAPPAPRPAGPVAAPNPPPVPATPTPPPAAVPPVAPAPAPVAPPAAPPTGAPSAEAAAAASIRSATRGTCAECKAGEWALSIDSIAPPAAQPGACTAAIVAGARAAMARAAQGLPPGTLAGSAIRADGLPAGIAGEGDQQACRLLSVALPAGAKYLGYRYDASDSGGAADCMQGQDCPIGHAGFAEHAAIERGANGSVVWALFENRDPARARRAELVVYYRPAGSAP